MYFCAVYNLDGKFSISKKAHMCLLDELLNFFWKGKQTKYNGSKKDEVENENRWPFI